MGITAQPCRFCPSKNASCASYIGFRFHIVHLDRAACRTEPRCKTGCLSSVGPHCKFAHCFNIFAICCFFLQGIWRQRYFPLTRCCTALLLSLRDLDILSARGSKKIFPRRILHFFKHYLQLADRSDGELQRCRRCSSLRFFRADLPSSSFGKLRACSPLCAGLSPQTQVLQPCGTLNPILAQQSARSDVPLFPSPFYVNRPES